MSLLLPIIYTAFISLGLPDSLLGSAWPEMCLQLNAPVSYAGIISMIISVGTILSSLSSDRVTRRLGAGRVTAISVALTASALFGFSLAPNFWVLCLIALPYGLGAGAVDAALNNYVALHYQAKHMSWLHCFWGLGASIGPYIMGACLTGGLGWQGGYRVISLLQAGLTAALLLTLPLWTRRPEQGGGQAPSQSPTLGLRELVRLPGAKAALTALICYQGTEQTAGLWAASYMVLVRGMNPERAASWAALVYLGIPAGRFLSGFITLKLNDQKMVRLGLAVTVLGIVCLLLPLGSAALWTGLLLIGMGCAPIYPSLLHETPANFGPDLSQAVMGLQMACAYAGTLVLPPLFGLLAQNLSFHLYPAYLLAMAAGMFFSCRVLDRQPKFEV